MRGFALVATVTMSLLMSADDNHAGEPKHWVPEGHLALPLRAVELPKAGAELIKTAFLGPGEPTKALEALRTSPVDTFKELRAVASGAALEARKRRKGVQPEGRIALLWWNVPRAASRRSTAAKDKTFGLDSDRLVAALALLDSAAIRAGNWRAGLPPTVPIPPRWLKSEKEGGFGVPSSTYIGGQAIGPALAGFALPSSGNFTPEPIEVNGARGALEKAIVEFATANPTIKVAILVVYTYPNATTRVPSGYRYSAVSADGRLARQFTFTTLRAGAFSMISENLVP